MSCALDAAGKESLRHHAADGDTPGYDISYIEDGSHFGVEVKGTVAEAFGCFELTEGEKEAAERLGDQYQVWLVSSVRTTKPRIQVLHNPAKMLQDGALAATPVLWRIDRT